MNLLLRIFLVLLLTSSSLVASTNEWYTQQPDKKVTLHVDLFLSSTCLHCQKADLFFRTLELTTPWLQVKRHIINENKNDLILFNQFLSAQHMDDFAVPSVFFCNSRWVGFANAQTTGRDLERALNYCKQQIEKKGELSEATINVLRRQGKANMFDSGVVGNPSPWYYLLVVALIDAFNPCSLFCLAGFFAFLTMASNRHKLLSYGFSFIIAVGLVHYVQQVHSTLFFEALPWLRIPAILIALFTLWGIGYCYKKNKTISYFLILPFLLALVIQAYQQTCAMNWSFVFEQWLHNQQASRGIGLLYRGVYQLIYLILLLIILLIYYFLINRIEATRTRARLKSIGLFIIAAIALLLIFYPWALAHMFLSLAVLLGLGIVGWFWQFPSCRTK